MDNPEQLADKRPTIISFCTGYGGLEQAIKRVFGSCRVLAYVEIEAFAIANLVAKMEAGKLGPAPVHTDVHTFPGKAFSGRVDFLLGGYPCQPFSAAGKRLGADDPRHLWPSIARAIRSIRPRFCFFENVEGHVTLGLKDVINDLGEMGYSVEAGLHSAAEVGAPHRRKRIFILAHTVGDGGRTDEPGRQAEERASAGGRGETMAHSSSTGLEGHSGDVNREGRQPDWQDRSVAARCLQRWPSRPGQPQYDWEEPRVVADTPDDHGRSGVSEAEAGTGPDGVGRVGPASGGSGHDLADSTRAGRVGDGSHGVRDDGNGVQGDPEVGGEIRSEAEGRSGTQGCPGGQIKPKLGGVPDGGRIGVDPIANRVDRLRLLGNGVVPAQATRALEILYGRMIDGQ